MTEEITVTGTRVQGRAATETPSPVDIINGHRADRHHRDRQDPPAPGALVQLLDHLHQRRQAAGRALRPLRHLVRRRLDDKPALQLLRRGGGPGFTPGFTQTWGAKWLTDLSIGYNVTDDLSSGGLNIFNEYPDDWDAVNAFPFPQLGFTYGWETLPFGINGGYFFARLSYRFDH